MELKDLIPDTQPSVEMERMLRGVSSDRFLRTSRKNSHLSDSVDAVLKEKERSASSEPGVCGRVEGGHGVHGCWLGGYG
jgi:hypothetical protein